MRDFASGTYTGTGAAINISLGWKPDHVKVYNDGDAGSLAPTMEWFRGMTDAHGLKGLKSIDSGSTGNASQATVTTNGISLYAGDSTHAEGFTIGADGDVNVSTEVGFWYAERSRTD